MAVIQKWSQIGLCGSENVFLEKGNLLDLGFRA